MDTSFVKLVDRLVNLDEANSISIYDLSYVKVLD